MFVELGTTGRTMVDVTAVLAGSIGTLVATLIGVYIAFKLDRRAGRRNKRRRVHEHLRSIKYELEMNQANADKVDQIIRHLQQTDTEAAHYILDIYSTDAWDSALDEQIIDNVDEGLYEDLQRTYTEIKRLNELIKRLRTEWLHPEIGDTRGSGGYEYRVWTTSLVTWDENHDKADLTSLGPLIQDRSRSVDQSIHQLSDLLEEEIDQLKDDSERTR